MTTSDPRPGYPAGENHPTPDSEPVYVTEQLPPGVPVYPAYGGAYGHDTAGSYGQPAADAYGQPATGSYGQPATDGGYAAYPSYDTAGYGGASYYGGYAAPGYGAGHPGAGPYPYQPTQGYPGYPGYHPPQPPPPNKRRRALVGVGAAVVAMGLLLAGAGIAESRQNDSSTTAQLPATGGTGGTGSGSTGSGSSGSGSGNQGVLPGGSGSTGTGNGTSTSAAVASKKQQVGVVTIVSVLGYQQAESAGTGMILTSDGEILTNNHVINGATSVTVTVESTGKSYRADVVGTAPTKDVAVLKLRNASGLATANIDQTPDAVVGDAVTGVGNAGGTGTLRAASGKITALEQSITATDESGSNAEKLTGLYQIDAGIISGDSGGPLYDADGQVIGMDTAASATQSQTQTAYAIPIDNALKVADQIESGTETSVIHIGLPAFLGVQVANVSGSSGATVAQAIADPAKSAGLTTGSVITKVDGTSVATADALHAALVSKQPGDSVSVSWTDTDGSTHTERLTLSSGPAD